MGTVWTEEALSSWWGPRRCGAACSDGVSAWEGGYSNQCLPAQSRALYFVVIFFGVVSAPIRIRSGAQILILLSVEVSPASSVYWLLVYYLLRGLKTLPPLPT